MLKMQYMYLKKKIECKKLIKPMFRIYPARMWKVFVRAQKSISLGGNCKCGVKWIFKIFWKFGCNLCLPYGRIIQR